MTSRKTKPASRNTAPSSGTETATDKATGEAAILLPDRDLEVIDPVTGETLTLTVREFRFLDGLRAQAQARGLIEDIAALAAEAEAMTPARMAQVIGHHAEAWTTLCALACARETDWIAALREPDASHLSMLVWEVNAAFFTTRILGQMLGGAALKAHWASLTSSASSPAPDMGDPKT